MYRWQLELLRINRPQLVKNINIKDGLYTELRSMNIITPRQEGKWRGNAEERQVELLLDYLLKRPSEEFYGFCTALRRNNQKHIVDNYLQKLDTLVDIPDVHPKEYDEQSHLHTEGIYIGDGNGNQDESRPCMINVYVAALIGLVVGAIMVLGITLATTMIHGGSCKSSPCQNGGICNDSGSTFRCTCPENTMGQLCEYMVKCDEIKQPHLQPSLISGIYGKSWHVKCEEGFTFRHGSVTKAIMCKNNEKWTTDLVNLQCIADTELTTVTQSFGYSKKTQHTKKEQQQLSSTKASVLAGEESSSPTEDHHPTNNDVAVTTRSALYNEKLDAKVQHGTKRMSATLTDQLALTKDKTIVANPITLLTDTKEAPHVIRTIKEFTTETVTSFYEYVSVTKKITPIPQSVEAETYKNPWIFISLVEASVKTSSTSQSDHSTKKQKQNR